MKQEDNTMAVNDPKSRARTGGHVPTGRFLTAITLAGLAIPAIITFVVKAEPLTISAAGRSLGATAFLVGAAALIVLPLRAFQSRIGKYTNRPLVYGTMIFVVFTLIFIVGAIKNISE